MRLAVLLCLMFCAGAASASTVSLSRSWSGTEGSITAAFSGADLDGDGWIESGIDSVSSASMSVTISGGSLSCDPAFDPACTAPAPVDLFGVFSLSDLAFFRVGVGVPDFSLFFTNGPENGFASETGASAELVDYGRYLLTRSISLPSTASATVPLPSSVWLVLAGLAILAGARRTKAA